MCLPRNQDLTEKRSLHTFRGEYMARSQRRHSHNDRVTGAYCLRVDLRGAITLNDLQQGIYPALPSPFIGTQLGTSCVINWERSTKKRDEGDGMVGFLLLGPESGRKTHLPCLGPMSQASRGFERNGVRTTCHGWVLTC